MKKGSSLIYALFGSDPKAHYVDKRPCITFACLKCKVELHRFLDTRDRSSTGNLAKHANKCWGHEVVQDLNDSRQTREDARRAAKGFLRDSNITRFFPDGVEHPKKSCVIQP